MRRVGLKDVPKNARTEPVRVEASPYEEMTKAELINQLSTLGVTCPRRPTKADLIDLLQNAGADPRECIMPDPE